MRIALFLALAASCRGPLVSDLSRPFFAIETDNGLCGSTFAVDGDGTTWAESGCEDGSKSLSRSSRKVDLAGVRAAFDALPDARTATCASDSSAPVNRLTLFHGVEGNIGSWRVCTSGGAPAAPYADAVSALGGP